MRYPLGNEREVHPLATADDFSKISPEQGDLIRPFWSRCFD